MKALKRALKNSYFQAVICYLAYLYIQLVFYTTRWHIIGCHGQTKQLIDSNDSLIFAFWHGRLLVPGCFSPKTRAAHVIISPHGDGRVISRVIGHLGISTIAGSSYDGGTKALKEAIRTLKRGDIVVITPDGPRGPRMRMTGHTITLARMGKAAIIPVAWSSNRRKVLGSWDRFILAWPFGRGVFSYGEPMFIPADASEEDMKKAGTELENRLNLLTAQADELVGVTPIEPAPAPSAEER